MKETKHLSTYPFHETENPNVIKQAIIREQTNLLNHSIFDGHNREEIGSCLSNYYERVDTLFDTEEQARLRGKSGANLFYHGKSHSLRQVTYDGIMITRAILARNDNFSSHITAEGALAIVLGSMFHDTGYVYKAPRNTNYAARNKLHVEESVRALSEIVTALPTGVDIAKVKNLAKIGIYNTYFPLTSEQKMAIDIQTKRLDPKSRKEAHIVRLAVELADLGGQTARVDYFDLARKLRDELNAAEEGKGDRTVGTDDEIRKRGVNFMDTVVRKTVGKTADAFFQDNNNSFSSSWNKNCKD